MSVCQRRSGHLHIYLHTIHVSTILNFFSTKRLLLLPPNNLPAGIMKPAPILFPLRFLISWQWEQPEPPIIRTKKHAKLCFHGAAARSFITPHGGSSKRKRSSLHFGSSFRWNLLVLGRRLSKFPPPRKEGQKKSIDLTSLSGIPMMMDVLTREVVTQLMLPVAMLMPIASRRHVSDEQVLRKATFQNGF